MKHPLIVILLLFFCHYKTQAQDAVSRIDVQFYDDQNKPVNGLFVQLMQAKDSSLAFSVFTGANGVADFSNVKPGRYFIYVMQFQYENYTSPIFIKKKEEALKLPAVTLKTKALKEVTVTAQVPFIEKQPDMTIVNVDKSPMNSGGSTMDVLEKSPGVVIDQNDNIDLQGKSGVTIMIDGKKVTMSGSELADFLRGLPADAIEKIELITNPGVKYDAEGSGGIINIVLKEGKIKGVNGTVTGAYAQGVYPKANGSINLNDRTQKLNLYLNYGYSYRKNFKDIVTDQNFYSGDMIAQTNMQHSYYVIPNNINTLHTGADFYASNKTTLGISLDGFRRQYQYNETSSSVFDSVGANPSYSNSMASDDGSEYDYTLEFNFKHKYDSLGHKLLTGLLNYNGVGFNDVQHFTNSYSGYVNADYQPPVLYGQIPFYNQIYTGQVDYATIPGEKLKLETGLKGIYSSLQANNQFYIGTSASAPPDTLQTQDFEYKQTIVAGYINLSKSINRGSISLGLRSEYTDATGYLLTTNQQIKQNYLYWFPHISYSDSVDKNNNLQLSAGTRFNRPDYGELDPFKNYINPTTYSQGNPELIPEYSYNVDVSEVYKSIYVFTLSYSLTQHPEETIHIPAPGQTDVTVIMDENLQLKDYYAFSISALPHITKWWTSNTYASLYYNQYKADVLETPINNGRIVFQGNTDNLFNITKRILFEVNGVYSSGAYAGYFQAAPKWLAGVGLQAKLIRDKLTAKLSVNDIFYSNIYNTSSYVNGYNENYIVKRDSRIAGVSITYKFGNSYSMEEEKTKKVEAAGDSPAKGL